MNPDLASRLAIRSMIYLAAEPIPFLWPMRTFIYNNPLHGLEGLPFAEAVTRGSNLFHARGYLSRGTYQNYLAAGEIDTDTLKSQVHELLGERDPVGALDLECWTFTMFTQCKPTLGLAPTLATPSDVRASLTGIEAEPATGFAAASTTALLTRELLEDCPIQEAIDALFGTEFSQEVDTLVIKNCLQFFDEGQATWTVPGREAGLFRAWRELSLHSLPVERHTRELRGILSAMEHPEDVIATVLTQMEVPEEHWIGYLTRELARTHGWSGFIRWRSTAKRYHWHKVFPGDLVDLMALRLALTQALLQSSKQSAYASRTALATAIEQRPAEMYLRSELYRGTILPQLAVTVEQALLRNKPADVASVFATYTRAKRDSEARDVADLLSELAQRTGQHSELSVLGGDELDSLLKTLAVCEQHEGMIWLRAMEAKTIQRVLNELSPVSAVSRVTRPFAQALFCIDTRSERIRRHLESVGDYQTFGIAGFFGVPVSFMGLGKGTETDICPVIVTPHNLVLEIAEPAELEDDTVLSVLGNSVHQLKESVVTPFVTVEAVGLLYGLEMIGRTFAPALHDRWQRRLQARRRRTHLLLDKLDRVQADSIVRAVQRGVIVRAIQQEFGLDPESVTDAMIRELRESALGHGSDLVACRAGLSTVEEQDLHAFIGRLQTDYEINTSFARLQLERLGRIGFTLDEQVNYVGQALRSIGLTENFSRFVLLTGHGSSSANNPYESALDCGACGGNHGLVSARVLAQMANKPQVRRRLAEQGIEVPDDTWFMPALHNTTTDEIELIDLELIPPTHAVYIDRLRQGLTASSRLCSQERIPTLGLDFYRSGDRAKAHSRARRNAMDWSQVRPEWGLARNAYFIIGTRDLTKGADLEGRAFLHSYDHRIDPHRRLLENILAGPLVVGQWINMEYYFSTVDNDRYGSGSKVNHNVAGRFGVMTGNISDLRSGLPLQTVVKDGVPYHEPTRLIAVIEAPLEHARQAVDAVKAVKQLVTNGWIRLLIVDPTTQVAYLFEDGTWCRHSQLAIAGRSSQEEVVSHG
ncbi:MAG: DUF2309 domain-containing protein [Nocardioides sp.]|nr:DUF2309 domain-containing protein [Nocardioides sp.]